MVDFHRLSHICIQSFNFVLQVQEWVLLNTDFTIPGGELGNVDICIGIAK